MAERTESLGSKNVSQFLMSRRISSPQKPIKKFVRCNGKAA